MRTSMRRWQGSSFAMRPPRRPERGSEEVAATSVSNNLAASLAQDLTEELQRKIELPGFPDIAVRLNQALRDENVAIRDIVRMINSEPALVSRLMSLANSASLNVSGVEVSDLKTAVARLGFNMVWSSVSSFAIIEMQKQEWLKPMRPWLADIWLSSNGTAAICYVLAKRIRVVSADEALTIGLFHRVGDLWLLTWAQKKGIDLQNTPEWDDAARKWQAVIGGQIVRKWGLPSHVIACVQQQDAIADTGAEKLQPYVQLLSAAKLYNRVRDRQGSEEAQAAAEALAETNLWGYSFLELVADCHDDIETMRRAIAG